MEFRVADAALASCKPGLIGCLHKQLVFFFFFFFVGQQRFDTDSSVSLLVTEHAMTSCRPDS